jgi:hypothetical protein
MRKRQVFILTRHAFLERQSVSSFPFVVSNERSECIEPYVNIITYEKLDVLRFLEAQKKCTRIKIK